MKKIFVLTVSALILLAARHATASSYQPYYYSYGGGTQQAQATVTTPAAAPTVTSSAYTSPVIITGNDNGASLTTTVSVTTAPVKPRYYSAASIDGQEVDTPLSFKAKKRYWDNDAILDTRSGIDVGFAISNYHYREPSLDVSLAGEKGSVDLSSTGHFWGENFVTGELRMALGTSDYSGSGRDEGKFEYMFDVRGLVGHDFAWKWYGISPYVGLGFRDLNSDDTGISSDGSIGYKRNNSLYYVPVGATQRLRLTPTDRISVRAEYDYVFYGLQTSYLGDAIDGYPNIENPQRHGAGVRAEIMWDTPYWSVGPFASYWAIAESQENTACGTAFCVTGVEPHNNTIEAGLRVKFHAFDF